MKKLASLAHAMGLILLAGASTVQAASKTAPAPSCDRECLRSMLTATLYGFLKHDTSKLPLGAKVRITEDAVEKTLDKVSLVKTVTKLRGYRQDFLDEREGMATAAAMVEEVGAPVLLVVRLKVVDQKITEMELVGTRSRADGLIFNIDGLNASSEVMNYAPRPEQLASREDVLKAGLKYPEGLNRAKTFADVGAPFTPITYRLENGQMMAGPDCKFAPGCENISTQSLAIFNRLGKVTTRVVGVDERLGIALLRLNWGVREPTGDQLTAFEAFKVYDGKIHAVEAYIRILPFAQAKGGWE